MPLQQARLAEPWYELKILTVLAAAVLTLLASSRTATAATAAELFARAPTTSVRVPDHTAWDRLLKTYVVEGADGLNRVDYRRFKHEAHETLRSYIASLEAIDVTSLSRPDQFALLANLYNAKTIDIVLTAYPVKSIKTISLGGGITAAFTGGPWKAKVVTLNRIPLSLDDIEHEVLRSVFKDPRVHYAVNCASNGCPNLQREAFTGVNLDRQLGAAARAYINHPRGFSVTSSGIIASSIYSWFKADFDGSDEGVLIHARAFAAPSLASALASRSSISEFRYDWGLNDIQR